MLIRARAAAAPPAGSQRDGPRSRTSTNPLWPSVYTQLYTADYPAGETPGATMVHGTLFALLAGTVALGCASVAAHAQSSVQDNRPLKVGEIARIPPGQNRSAVRRSTEPQLLAPIGASIVFSSVLRKNGDEGYLMCGNSGIVVTNLGTTIAFLECPKSRWADDGNWQDVVVKRSPDSGRSWGPSVLVHSESGPQHHNATVTIGNPAPVFDAVTNTTIVLMCRNNSYILVSRSTDDGRSWSAARDITAQAKPDRLQWGWVATTFSGIQLRHSPQHRGRLLFCADHIKGQWSAYPAIVHASHVIISDDGGNTFRVGGSLAENLTTDECALSELADGTVLMNSRNCFGNLGPQHDCDGSNSSLRALTNSSTGGESWATTHFAADLPEPVCEGSMISPRSGLLLFSNPTR